MKKILPALAGLLAMAFAQPAISQTATPCDVKGIRTIPGVAKLGGAYNPEYPTRRNTFNWFYGEQNSGRWWNLNCQSQPNATAIWLPWEQSDNPLMTHILGKRDLPGDGWELIKRNLGYLDSGAPAANLVNPYVVLYNKHSGMLRVFVATGMRVQDYQFVEIKLLFNTNGAQKKAGTLNRLEGIGVPLDRTVPGPNSGEFAAVTRFLNQDTKWFMADFPMEYDPCACQFDSKLKIEVNLISQANIQITGVTTGTLLTNNASTGATSTSSDFDGAINLFKKVNGVLSASQKTYNTIGSYSTNVRNSLTALGARSSVQDANDKKTAFTQFANSLASNSFLKGGLNAVPYIGAAVSIMDSFFGGGKDGGSQAVSLQPMSIEMTTKMTGTLSATALYEAITFNNPGTRIITIPEEYPYYNEALGVLSVLRTPVVEVKSTGYQDADGRNRRLYQYRVPNPIQYVINPASGLEVQDFQVALLQGGRNYPAILPGAATAWYYEGMSGTTHVMRTDYRDANCLSNDILELDVSGDNLQDPATSEFRPTITNSPNVLYPTYLKFMLNLRRLNATTTSQNVLLVLKFPVIMQEVTVFDELISRPCGILPQVDVANIQSFCTSATYTSAVSLRSSSAAQGAGASAVAAIAAVAAIQVYPNPANDAATINFSMATTGQVSAYLTDVVGRRALTIMRNEFVAVGEQRKTFSTTALVPGLYQCVIEAPGGYRFISQISVER